MWFLILFLLIVMGRSVPWIVWSKALRGNG